jgi:hypothetical protein
MSPQPKKLEIGLAPGVRRSRSKSNTHKVQTRMNNSRISLRTFHPPNAASAKYSSRGKNFRLSLCCENSSVTVNVPRHQDTNWLPGVDHSSQIGIGTQFVETQCHISSAGRTPNVATSTTARARRLLPRILLIKFMPREISANIRKSLRFGQTRGFGKLVRPSSVFNHWIHLPKTGWFELIG